MANAATSDSVWSEGLHRGGRSGGGRRTRPWIWSVEKAGIEAALFRPRRTCRQEDGGQTEQRHAKHGTGRVGDRRGFGIGARIRGSGSDAWGAGRLPDDPGGDRCGGGGRRSARRARDLLGDDRLPRQGHRGAERDGSREDDPGRDRPRLVAGSVRERRAVDREARRVHASEGLVRQPASGERDGHDRRRPCGLERQSDHRELPLHQQPHLLRRRGLLLSERVERHRLRLPSEPRLRRRRRCTGVWRERGLRRLHLHLQPRSQFARRRRPRDAGEARRSSTVPCRTTPPTSAEASPSTPRAAW